VTAVIETEGLGKRYRKLWALADCTLSIPAGHVVGLVGPNGAGKTTLLSLATGMLGPDHRRDRGTRQPARGRPGAAGPGRLPRPGCTGLRRAVGRRPPEAGRAPQPGVGCGTSA
jgi:ABC-2 type transport system ATP-binding protein